MMHIMSYGGGVNSSAMLFYILRHKLPLNLVIFSDTGEEEPPTYDAVKRMRELCLSRDIAFQTVKSKHGNLYDYYYFKNAVPSIMRRDCTSKFKIAPIRQHIRARYGKKERFGFYIGIAWDEVSRVRDSDVKYIDNLYPLVEARITREGCFKILEEEGFTAKKSGCKGCPFRPRKEWHEMVKSDSHEFRRWRILEENCSAFPRVTLLGRVKLGDIEKAIKEQRTLLEWENPIPCDVAGGCFL